MVKKTFHKRDETGVDLYLSLTLYGFKSTYGAQFLFAFVQQGFVASIAQIQLSSIIEYPTEYSDGVNLSSLMTEKFFTGSVDEQFSDALLLLS